MIGILLKAKIKSVFASVLKSKKKKTPLLTVALAVLFLYVFVCAIMMFGLFFDKICEPFHQMGIDWFYFAFMVLLALMLMIVLSIFMTQSQLYQAKDNELLLSMPIPPKYILASRMLTIYVFQLFFELLVFLPAVFLYSTKIGISMTGVFWLVLFALVLPLFSLALSCAAGWVLEKITSQIQHKTLVTMIVYFAFLGIYFYGYAKAAGAVGTMLAKGEWLAGKVKSIALPIYWAGQALTEGNMLYGILVLCICFVPFAIVWALLDKTFVKSITMKKTGVKKVYQKGSMKQQSMKKALFFREWKHFCSSPIYIFNSSMGVIFLTVSIVFLVLKQDMVEEYLQVVFAIVPEMEHSMEALVAALLGAMAMTNMLTAPSVSLEGKQLWIIRSMPIKTKEILLAKMKLHLAVTVPFSILGGIIAGSILALKGLSYLLVFILPFLCNVFSALLGLIVNLYFPNLDWISETAAVKQGMSSLVTMCVSLGVIVIVGLAYYKGVSSYMSLTMFEVLVCGILAVMCVALMYLLLTRGRKLWEKLS